jgi:DNA-nicking Smr family endonuclease
MTDSDDPVVIPITGELDLHTFAPRDVSRVVEAYLEACLERKIYRIRIVHGKGIGTLRATVHARLRRLPAVVGFQLGNETNGSWGATIVTLKKPPEAQ